ncbi:MAG: HD domain-containing protein [Clostridia bacterium]|nr:HD domain-containing protein [Clostridia bacterium]
MDQRTYALLEGYMLSCMADAAHDKDHVYRVLMGALAIAEGNSDVNTDVLIAACLLHDVARPIQLRDPSICHAMKGAEMARSFLLQQGFPADFADHVHHCIQTHRFRKSCQPQSLEAKILFDADKLDVCGAIGIARTLIYNGTVGRALYTAQDGCILDGSGDEPDSFFREYKFKLENIYGHFYTQEGRAMAESRRAAATAYYTALLGEVRDTAERGREALEKLLC